MFIFGKDRINALNERIETLGQQSAKEADATRQALEGHTKALTERLSAIQEALSRRCGEMRAGALLFSDSFGLLGMTTEAEKELKHWRQNT